MNTETLRDMCLKMLSAKEDIKWGADLVFTIGGKMFCVTSFEEPFKASFKTSDEEFEELCSCEGVIPAPYMARAKWVQVTNAAGFNKMDWERRVAQSYRLVAAKLSRKEKRELGIE